MLYFKRIAALILCLAMLLCSFSCGNDEPDDEIQGGDQTEDSGEQGDGSGDGTDGGEEEFDPYPYEDLSVFMDLPDYKNITITQAKLDELVNNIIMDYVAENDLYTQVFDRAVKNGDKVKIDFVGTLDGEAFIGGTASDYELVIGSGSFIDGFESGVIGMNIGDVKDLNLRFPDNYTEDLAGKDVVFTVTLDEIWTAPKVDDAFCVENTKFATADEFLKTLRQDCIFDYAWNEIMQQCKIKAYPDEYTEYYQSYVNWFSSLASQSSVTLEEFLQKYGSYYSGYGLYNGMSTAEFYRVAENYAESNLVNDLLMYSLLRTEGIKAEGEQFEKAKARLADEYGTTYEALVEEYGSTAVTISALNIVLAEKMAGYVTVK